MTCSRRLLCTEAALLAILVTVIVIGSARVDGVSLFGMLTGVCAACALPLIPSHPAPVAVLVPGALFLYLATGNAGGPALLVGPISMVLIGYFAPRPIAVVAAAAMIAAYTAGHLVGFGTLGAIGAAGPAWAVALVLLGRLAAVRRERRADESRRLRLERLQAVTAERLRIARDLHDSVGHALATVSVQANVADRLLRTDPDAARTALAAIHRATADALDELGHTLNALRDDETDPGDTGRGIDFIPDLVDRARTNGLMLTERRTGSPTAAVPSAIGTAAYRVVQESLSNIVRHAGPSTSASLHVDRRPGHLRITISDNGPTRRPATPHPSSGRGLIGMHERVATTGGTLRAGFRADRPGFEVVAEWAFPRDARGARS